MPGGCREFYEFYGCYYHGCDVCYTDRSRVVRCKSQEQGYVTIDKVRIDMFERERMIRSLAKFDCTKDKWITLWEHEFNERFEEFKSVLGVEVIDSLPDRLDPRNAVKGGRTEVFKIHTKVTDMDSQVIRYLDVNSLYPYVMSKTKFPIGHPMIRRGHASCIDLMNELKRHDEDFIGICMICVLAPRELMILYLPHKCDGKLMFLLCKKCSSRNNVQRLPCKHNDHERSWIDTYTSIDMQGALLLGYKVVEYTEVWHYREGGGNMFEEFILNIVRCKIECSGFPRWCTTHELKQQYVDGLFKKSSISTNVESIRNDPAGRYLNKIMANSIWGKWTQNPSGQQEIKMCGSMHEYHDFLKTGFVKRVSLISDKLLQVELKLDRQIDGENRERRNCRSGLGGKNVIVGAFVMAASRDLMYFRYLSKLTFDQLLYTDTDSVIMYRDFNRADHVMSPTSDLLGDLKDEYEDVLKEHPTWYIDEVIAFGPKMYHLIL